VLVREKPVKRCVQTSHLHVQTSYDATRPISPLSDLSATMREREDDLQVITAASDTHLCDQMKPNEAGITFQVRAVSMRISSTTKPVCSDNRDSVVHHLCLCAGTNKMRSLEKKGDAHRSDATSHEQRARAVKATRACCSIA
jgi:hypothetical protein